MGGVSERHACRPPSQVAPTLSSEPFVFEVSRSASQATFDEQLAEFMAVVKSGDSSTRIQEWAHSKLTMDSVFSVTAQKNTCRVLQAGIHLHTGGHC